MHEALIIHPVDVQWVPHNPEQIIKVLHDIGLIDRNNNKGNSYEFGDAFTRMITFLGCSPALYSSKGDQLFSITLLLTPEAPVFVAGNLAKPRCRQCRQVISDWQQCPDSPIQCPHCNTKTHITELYWKRQAGMLRYAIMIRGIMNGIAVPADSLLVQLRETSHCDWNYFYYSDSSTWPDIEQ